MAGIDREALVAAGRAPEEYPRSRAELGRSLNERGPETCATAASSRDGIKSCWRRSVTTWARSVRRAKARSRSKPA